MTSQNMAGLSISTLKAILLTNHVNAGLILEKGELVVKVKELVEEERRRRERQRMMELVEEAEASDWQSEITEDHRPSVTPEEEPGVRDDFEEWKYEGGANRPSSKSPPPMPRPFLERDGLCIVCFDNEANIAIVDCGFVSLPSSLPS
jgi:hypothetical protein